MSDLGEAPRGVALPAPPTAGFAFGFALITVIFAAWTFLTASHDQAFGPLNMETGEQLALWLWVAAPVIGGAFGRRLSNRGLGTNAAFLGAFTGLAIALFPTSGFGGYLCSIALPPGAITYMLGRLAMGALVGGGMGAALFISGFGLRRRLAALPAIALAAAVNYAGSWAAYTVFYEGVRCT